MREKDCLGEVEAVCGIWEQYGEKEGVGSIEGGMHYGKSKQYGLGGRQVWGLESGSMEGRRAIGGEGERGEVRGVGGLEYIKQTRRHSATRTGLSPVISRRHSPTFRPNMWRPA